MNVALQAHPDGVVLPVRAQPKARKNAITGEHAGALKVAVTEPAEKGKANTAIIALLAKQFGLAKSQVELLAGHTSSQKRFLLRGASLEAVAEKIHVLRKDYSAAAGTSSSSPPGRSNSSNESTYITIASSINTTPTTVTQNRQSWWIFFWLGDP